MRSPCRHRCPARVVTKARRNPGAGGYAARTRATPLAHRTADQSRNGQNPPGARWPFADRKHGCFLERRDSRSHILHRRRRDVEIDGVSTYPVVSDRMPSHHQARQTGVLKGRHDLGQTGLDTQWIESSHGRLPCARRSLTSSWRPNSSSVSRWASSAISARCASRTMLSASAVELARPDKRSASISASMALGEGAIVSSLRLVIVGVLSGPRRGRWLSGLIGVGALFT